MCEYEFNGATEGFAGNVSQRSNEGPPKDWVSQKSMRRLPNV